MAIQFDGLRDIQLTVVTYKLVRLRRFDSQPPQMHGSWVTISSGSSQLHAFGDTTKVRISDRGGAGHHDHKHPRSSC
jgi:hypothetical protein